MATDYFVKRRSASGSGGEPDGLRTHANGVRYGTEIENFHINAFRRLQHNNSVRNN